MLRQLCHEQQESSDNSGLYLKATANLAGILAAAGIGSGSWRSCTTHGLRGSVSGKARQPRPSWQLISHRGMSGVATACKRHGAKRCDQNYAKCICPNFQR